MLLGCIGDDFTGSSDLANTLARNGMHTVQYVGVPDTPADKGVEAGVVALKSRSIPVDQAVAQSLQALDWLRAQGARQILFKYCSTFDSTPAGNIGPVAEALADALGARMVLVCPAFPAAGRSVYQGHLFVGDRLLSESGMQHHPLTPMTDPDLRRWLARQCTGPIGHLPAEIVAKGPHSIRDAMQRIDGDGPRLIVADAIHDKDLRALGHAAKGLALITGGSGIAMGLPDNFRADLGKGTDPWQAQTSGRTAILSGSCSDMTRAQVARHCASNPALELDVEAVMADRVTVADLVAWALGQQGLPLIYSSADPAKVRQMQDLHGQEAVAATLEDLFARTARALVDAGVTRLITAGGETSGAVVAGLGVQTLSIGPEIAPGVPAVRARPDLVLALKSGNFGAVDFFAQAAATLGHPSERPAP